MANLIGNLKQLRTVEVLELARLCFAEDNYEVMPGYPPEATLKFYFHQERDIRIFCRYFGIEAPGVKREGNFFVRLVGVPDYKEVFPETRE